MYRIPLEEALCAPRRSAGGGDASKGGAKKKQKLTQEEKFELNINIAGGNPRDKMLLDDGVSAIFGPCQGLLESKINKVELSTSCRKFWRFLFSKSVEFAGGVVVGMRC